MRGKQKPLRPGIQIGHWLLLERVMIDGNGYWKCTCTKCGTGPHNVREYSLRLFRTLHCRACNPGRPRKYEVVEGNKYGWWIVMKIQRASSGRPHKVALCQCRCGTEREIPLHPLASGQTLSCGCGRSYFSAVTSLIKSGDLNSIQELAHRKKVAA